jgi:hypothetical protein
MGTGLRGGDVGAAGRGGGGGGGESAEDEARARKIILNQIQSLQAMSRLVTPAGSNISDNDGGADNVYSYTPLRDGGGASSARRRVVHPASSQDVGLALSADGDTALDKELMKQDVDTQQLSTSHTHALQAEQNRQEQANK